jgi:hypothetical protein
MAGRSESRVAAEYQIGTRHLLKGEAIWTHDGSGEMSGDMGNAMSGAIGAATGAAVGEKRADTRGELGSSYRSGGYGPGGSVDLMGAQIALERVLTPALRAEIGSRHVHGVMQTGYGEESVDALTARARLTSAVPRLPRATVYGDYEQDVRDSARRALALGGDYQLSSGSRLYVRHEVISSLGSLYEFNRSQRTFRTLAGIDSDYMKDGRVFSEYRLGSALGGRDAQAALGLRNGWALGKGLRLGTTFERTRTLGRQGEGGAQDGRHEGGASESTALTGALEYLADSRWKGSTALELRRSSHEDSVLSTLGVAIRLTPEWTLLAKNALYRPTGRGQRHSGDTWRLRQRFGLAFRQAGPAGPHAPSRVWPAALGGLRINALAYYEHRFESGQTGSRDTQRRQVHIVSGHVNLQPGRQTTLSGRIAAKQLSESGYGIASQVFAQLYSARLTRDIGTRWDAGVAASSMRDNGGQRRHAFGVEAGYRIKRDLWLSVGYNFVGFADREFGDMAQTARGMYLRLRYKFDETSFG